MLAVGSAQGRLTAVSAYLDQADWYVQEAWSELMQTEPKVRQVE